MDKDLLIAHQGATRGHAMLIFDGDCGFCRTWVQRIRSARNGRPEAVAWQALDPEDLRGLGLRQRDVESAAYWVTADGRLWRGHRAIAGALIDAGGIRAVAGRCLLLPGISPLGSMVYALVARYRHRLSSPNGACSTPSRR